MLKVCKCNDYMSGTKHHIVRDYYYAPSKEHLQSLMVQYACEDKACDRTPTKNMKTYLSNFDKKKHTEKNVCEKCIEVLKQLKKNGSNN